MNLDYFNDENFHGSLKRFFKELNIPVSYIAEEPTTAEEILGNTYKPNNPAHKLMEYVYFLGMVDDEAFKKQTDELYPELREKAGKDYEGILIFGVTLNSDKGRLPVRGQMFEITRAFNREFHYTPVIVVFKYQQYISFANCERTAYEQKWREGEKVGRVSLLKDVDTRQPHTGHLKILQTLEIRRKGKGAITSFEGLYQYWQEVFSISLLSKNFYRELSNWYFWALQHVDFPDDFEKDEQVRNAVNVIRLITRMMFCWFMKEKGLIPDTLFDEEELKDCLNFKDVNGSTYYKAILQNLFFATLNTEMQKDNPKSRQFMNRRYGIQEFYRHDRLFKDKHDALELFRDIPFLNGGLFENLDRNVGLSDEIRIDCFSNRPANSERLRVPDFLFFGDEDEVDLSKVYGDKKRKKETARGLIRILKSYKFTVAENTPIEEEIALDPELLGKVFENLLASYNPETQTTARKQTGSFYTPREIVNYMVDESLIAYFSNALVPADDEDLKKESDDRLRQLLSYSAQGHSFTDDEAEIIIGALDNAKILDPACGSGAFPMGILHKMVHMLGKVDPENARWKQKQMDKIAEISDITVREKLLEDVEESFKGNELDYGRKLYLIQNCIFGVDIHPIAVQIAKLRFFISLIADQKVDRGKKNLGILPLPNLETKFVAANTLMGIERSGQLMLQSPEIDKKQEELADVRQKHFSARTPKTKAKYRESDENLRAELAQLLKERGSFGEDVAEKLANWDPYDQNASAKFFDSEWVFGVRRGFDITIGNPPYVRADSGEKHLELREAIESGGQYETLWEKWDLYIPFIERSYKLLKQGGISTLIVSDAFCHSKYAQKSQKWFLKNSRIIRLDFFSKIKIFEASVHNITYFFQRVSGLKNKPERRVHEPEFGAVRLLPTDEQQRLTYRVFFPEDTAAKQFSVSTVLIKEICYISYGLRPSSDKNDEYERFITADLLSQVKDEVHYKPYVDGKHLDRWLPITNLWIEWGTDRSPTRFCRPTFPEMYNISEKILVQRSPGPNPKACYDNQQLIFTPSSVGFILWHNLSGVRNRSIRKSARYKNEKPPRPDLPKREKLEKISRRFAVKYLLAIMNSEVAGHFLRTYRRSNIHLYPDDWKQLPIPDIPSEQQAPIIAIVDKIIAAKQKDPNADTIELEKQIDLMVYKLYNLTYEEVKIVEPDFAMSRADYENFQMP